MNELITLGQIVKAQGIKGEVKVKPFTDDISRFLKLRAVFLDSVPFKIESLRISEAFVFVKFSGISDRNAAQSLVSKLMQIDRVHAVAPDDGAYFIADVIGCGLYLDGVLTGKVINVYQHGAADVFEVKTVDGKTLLFPHLKKLNISVDTEAKKILCSKELLDSVAVYQD